MTRRIKRLRDFEISLQVKSDTFIRPPRDAQRNWLLNGALTELIDNLTALDGLAEKFVRGVDAAALEDRTQADLGDAEIMEEWQIPVMQAMSDTVTEAHGDILEIGFGRGIASTMIQELGVRSHTIIECNDSIVARLERWRAGYPDREIRLLHGLWQDVLADAGQFDGIFFHTYPLNEEEFIEQIAESATFAAHFFPHAAEHLVDGGVFTYLSNEIDSLSRTHQRLLFEHFKSIRVEILRALDIPEDVKDAWWADSMAIISAIE